MPRVLKTPSNNTRAGHLNAPIITLVFENGMIIFGDAYTELLQPLAGSVDICAT